MQPTRLEILEILKRQGQATVDDLAKKLGITLMAVRLHLVVLERDNLVTRSTMRMGPGRPTLIYRLTAHAEDTFPKSYDDLASGLLQAMRLALGSTTVESVCLQAAHGMASRLRDRVVGDSVGERVASYVEAMAEKGHVMESGTADSGYVLNSFTCPFYRVARAHREVCVLHRNLLRDLFDAEVETMSCQLDGDLRCSYLVRVPAAVESTSIKCGEAEVPAL
ncbi:MAG: helix-turn-helix transcriptional regulator [Chloroflexota bacterium]